MKITGSRKVVLVLVVAAPLAPIIGCGAADEDDSQNGTTSGEQASGGTGTAGAPALQLGGSAGLGGDPGWYCWSPPHERTSVQGRSAPLCSPR